MRVFKAIAKGLAVIFALILLIVVAVFAIRTFNDNKYKPKDYDPQNAPKFNDISQYTTKIEGVTVERIEGDYLNGFHLKPLNKSHKGLVITFGGSEGSPNYEMAQIMAKKGYEVLSLFYFGMENQKKELVDVPLDFFDEVLAYIDKGIEDNRPITLYGGSKGAELALNLATYYPQIDNLILMAPSEYTFMGLSYENYNSSKSSWTWKGEELPFINVQKGDPKDGMNLFKAFLLNEPISYRPGYESAVKNAPNKEEARIKVEDIKADILAFAGEKDRMWQSDIAAREIQKRRADKTEIHIYPEAGHLFFGDSFVYMGGVTLAMGGSKEANDKAGEDSTGIIFDKLSQWHEEK